MWNSPTPAPRTAPQGDTVPAAHLVIGEHTGAAAAYVGMTRGRTANTAHLLAADHAEARAQWIAVFARDRADLDPGHAAALAAAEATLYAQPRPLDQALADLHAAWTAEQHCLDGLALAQSRRHLLRDLAARETGLADQLRALEVTCAQTALAAQLAQQRADARAAAIATDASCLRSSLLAAWDAQRDAAAQAARILLDGPGLLGLRRAAVARASEQLTAWGDTWRPYLPAMPADSCRIAALAATADDRPRLEAAFAGHARRSAEAADPEHHQLIAAADAAQSAHDRARRDLTHARRQHEDHLARLTAPGHHCDAAARLVDAERDVTAADAELAAARARIQQLRVEPALLSLPADRLAWEHDTWRAQRGADRPPRRPASLRPAPDPGVRQPRPEPDRQPAGHPGAGLDLGR
jgi:exodeoxyribonuclease V alpha subunit